MLVCIQISQDAVRQLARLGIEPRTFAKEAFELHLRRLDGHSSTWSQPRA